MDSVRRVLAQERRRKLDHDRYMRQREERLQKRHEIYYADVEASREYYRNYRKKRKEYEIRRFEKTIRSENTQEAVKP